MSRYRLLTRDAARFRTYFPSVHLITPGENDDQAGACRRRAQLVGG